MDRHVGKMWFVALASTLMVQGCQLEPDAPFTGEPQAFTSEDAGMLARLGAGCDLEVVECRPGDCVLGTRCIPDGCGRLQCQASGLACLDTADCPDGSACYDGPLGSVCLPSGACADLRDCPAGHACEAGLCVDERAACESDAGCAEGSYCERELAAGMPFCTPISRPCAHHAACRPGASCVDPDGDGHGDCAAD